MGRRVIATTPAVVMGSGSRSLPLACPGLEEKLFRCLPALAQIGPIRQRNPVLKGDAGAPAERGETADVEQLARRAVGTRDVVADRAGVADDGGGARANSAIEMSSPVPMLTIPASE